MQRRTFIAGMGAVGAMSSLREIGRAESGNSDPGSLPRTASAGTLKGEMLYRPLGRTGETVSAIGLGGFHIGQVKDEGEAIRLIHQAIDRGLTFMDNSWDYNEGRSEQIMGKALTQEGYRKKAFLMTKIDGRTKEEANRQLNESLSRLQTDHVDLLQHHEVIRFDDPDRIFAEGGAMEAIVEAKKAGKVRHIGFTGHKDPHIHVYMLEVAKRNGFQLDTAQMPLNPMDAHFRSFARTAVPKMMEQQVAVLGMKSMGEGILLKSNTVTAMECLHFALNLPTSVVITGIDNQRVLDQAFEATKTFKLMSEQQVSALLSKTRDVALAGKYELFKTSTHFDSTVKHPEWLGGESPEVQKLGARG